MIQLFFKNPAMQIYFMANLTSTLTGITAMHCMVKSHQLAMGQF